MFENNTDRMFWTIAVLILGATLLMIGNKAFPKAQESIMTTISQNIETGNNSSKSINVTTNPDSDDAKQSDFEKLKSYDYDYNSDGTINITKYKGSSKNIIMPTYGPAQNNTNLNNAVKITTISLNNGRNTNTGAFSNQQMTNIEMPKYLKIIGTYAFNKNNLTNVNIPNTVTRIDYAAFELSKIQNIHLSTSLEKIDEYVFENNKLSDVEFPKSLKSVGWCAFDQNNLKKVNLESNTTNLAAHAFYHNNIESVTISKKVTNVYSDEIFTHIDGSNPQQISFY